MAELITIPVITDPLGASWEQPSSANMLIDDESAIMSQADLDKLAEYSMSNPTGAYEGKMWKRLGQINNIFYLCWYSTAIEEGYLDINFRRIIIL